MISAHHPDSSHRQLAPSDNCTIPTFPIILPLTAMLPIRPSVRSPLPPLCGLIFAAMLGGCASTVPQAPPITQAPVVAPVPVPLAPSADQAALADGIALYNKGQFNDAIKRLGGADINGGSKANQLAALKYSAFSYCVTSRTTLCRQQFAKALKLDPAFDLAQGEQGHPLWGPAFARAKKGK